MRSSRLNGVRGGRWVVDGSERGRSGARRRRGDTAPPTVRCACERRRYCFVTQSQPPPQRHARAHSHRSPQVQRVAVAVLQPHTDFSH